MTKALLILISFICFSSPSWSGDAFLITGQSVGGEQPTSDLRIYRWQEHDTKLKLEEKVEFPNVGVGGIYELGMNHDKRLFVAVGGWSPSLNKAPMTIFQFQRGKVTKQPYMLNLDKFFEFYFHESGKVAVQLDGPLGEWFLIDPDAIDRERKTIVNKKFYHDELLSTNVFTQSANDGMFPSIQIDAYGNIGTHWANNVSPSFALKKVPHDFFKYSRSFLYILNNSSSLMVMGGFGKNEKELEQPLVIWDKIKDKWTYNWIPARLPVMALAMENYVVFQVAKGKFHNGTQPQTGDFIFYSIAKNVMFRVHVGEDSEVFDIDEAGWVLYRAGDTLYKAQIQKDSLGKPIKLVTDPAIKGVHWGLWAEYSPSTNMVEPQKRKKGSTIVFI